MILICKYNNEEELNELKQMANNGSTIYTQVNDITVKLLPDSKAIKALKSEVDVFIKTFRFQEDTAAKQAENIEENTSSNVTTSPTLGEISICKEECSCSRHRGFGDCRGEYRAEERIERLENRVDEIILALRKPIMQEM